MTSSDAQLYLSQEVLDIIKKDDRHKALNSKELKHIHHHYHRDVEGIGYSLVSEIPPYFNTKGDLNQALIDKYKQPIANYILYVKLLVVLVDMLMDSWESKKLGKYEYKLFSDAQLINAIDSSGVRFTIPMTFNLADMVRGQHGEYKTYGHAYIFVTGLWLTSFNVSLEYWENLNLDEVMNRQINISIEQTVMTGVSSSGESETKNVEGSLKTLPTKAMQEMAKLVDIHTENVVNKYEKKIMGA